MKDKFYFDKANQSFIGRIQFLSKDIELEIRKNELEVDWEEVEKFVSSFEDDYLPKIIDTSSKLLLEFIHLVPFGVKPPFDRYSFRLAAVIYYGKVDNLIFSELVDGFELVFKLYHSDYIECEDPYGNYKVRVDNRLITGLRREQV